MKEFIIKCKAKNLIEEIRKEAEKMEKFNLKNIKKRIQKREDVYLTNIAENKNGVFKDFKYLTFEYNDFYYYLEENDFYDITVTSYKKINWNTKKQWKYLKSINNFKELKTYILETENKKNGIKNTGKQTILFEFLPFKSINEKEYRNIFERINLGWREKEILKDIQHVEHVQNDGFYNVFKIIDNQNNYFEIDVKNQKIVG